MGSAWPTMLNRFRIKLNKDTKFKRVLVIILATICVTFTSGVFFGKIEDQNESRNVKKWFFHFFFLHSIFKGWQALLLVLKRENVYAHLCSIEDDSYVKNEEGAVTCAEQ